MNLYTILGSGIGFTLYLCFAWQVRRKSLPLSMATFLLWGILDAINAISTYRKDGAWLLPVMYSIGGLLICRELWLKRLIKWTWFESLITGLVLVCLIGWAYSGDRTAIILSGVSVFLAGLPQCMDSLEMPAEQPLGLYAGFFAANGLAMMGGTEWSVEQMLYSTLCFGITILVVLPLMLDRIKRRVPFREWI
ncbi:MAG: hypothetical protein JWN89_80 [Parcubacteria group bacterium]|nr:hypothetical protein [Parcubacteria group bacterium]